MATLKELREKAKAYELKGYSKLNKAQLEELISKYDQAAQEAAQEATQTQQKQPAIIRFEAGKTYGIYSTPIDWNDDYQFSYLTDSITIEKRTPKFIFVKRSEYDLMPKEPGKVNINTYDEKITIKTKDNGDEYISLPTSYRYYQKISLPGRYIKATDEIQPGKLAIKIKKPEPTINIDRTVKEQTLEQMLELFAYSRHFWTFKDYDNLMYGKPTKAEAKAKFEALPHEVIICLYVHGYNPDEWTSNCVCSNFSDYAMQSKEELIASILESGEKRKRFAPETTEQPATQEAAPVISTDTQEVNAEQETPQVQPIPNRENLEAICWQVYSCTNPEDMRAILDIFNTKILTAMCRIVHAPIKSNSTKTECINAFIAEVIAHKAKQFASVITPDYDAAFDEPAYTPDRQDNLAVLDDIPADHEPDIAPTAELFAAPDSFSFTAGKTYRTGKYSDPVAYFIIRRNGDYITYVRADGTGKAKRRKVKTQRFTFPSGKCYDTESINDGTEHEGRYIYACHLVSAKPETPKPQPAQQKKVCFEIGKTYGHKFSLLGSKPLFITILDRNGDTATVATNRSNEPQTLDIHDWGDFAKEALYIKLVGDPHDYIIDSTSRPTPDDEFDLYYYPTTYAGQWLDVTTDPFDRKHRIKPIWGRSDMKDYMEYIYHSHRRDKEIDINGAIITYAGSWTYLDPKAIEKDIVKPSKIYALDDTAYKAWKKSRHAKKKPAAVQPAPAPETQPASKHDREPWQKHTCDHCDGTPATWTHEQFIKGILLIYEHDKLKHKPHEHIGICEYLKRNYSLVQLWNLARFFGLNIPKIELNSKNNKSDRKKYQIADIIGNEILDMQHVYVCTYECTGAPELPAELAEHIPEWRKEFIARTQAMTAPKPKHQPMPTPKREPRKSAPKPATRKPRHVKKIDNSRQLLICFDDEETPAPTSTPAKKKIRKVSRPRIKRDYSRQLLIDFGIDIVDSQTNQRKAA